MSEIILLQYMHLACTFCGSLLKVMWFKHSTTQGFYNTFNSNLAFIAGQETLRNHPTQFHLLTSSNALLRWTSVTSVAYHLGSLRKIGEDHNNSSHDIWFDGIAQWAAGGFEEFLNIMNFYVFLILWDNRVNKL